MEEGGWYAASSPHTPAHHNICMPSFEKNLKTVAPSLHCTSRRISLSKSMMLSARQLLLVLRICKAVAKARFHVQRRQCTTTPEEISPTNVHNTHSHRGG